MINRERHIKALLRQLASFEVTAILGPRQVGKTTLARQVGKAYRKPYHHFDLEDPVDLNRLQADANLALRGLKGLVVIDEIQRMPGLFPLLRVLADRRPRPARFLVLGSASPDLLKQGSESLAGRISYHELTGFALDEIGAGNLPARWLRGGFPDAYLSRSHRATFVWLENFARTFLERDLPQLGFRTSGTTLRRFWTMLAHWQGQVWNSSEFARSFGVADTTIRRYLDILTDALVVRQLQPWHENINKRQVKAPKIYIRDTGLLHCLLRINDMKALDTHPKMGASWEGLLIELVREQLDLREAYFWATHSGAELDLLAMKGGKRIGVEIKRTTTPSISKSMHQAMQDLRLDKLVIVHAGSDSYALEKKVTAVAAARLLDDLKL